MSDAGQDPHQEPSGGEVEGWLGQEVAEDEELVDRLVAEENGDIDAAEERFEEESAGAQPDDQDTPRAEGA
jgi:hypothetical protein